MSILSPETAQIHQLNLSRKISQCCHYIEEHAGDSKGKTGETKPLGNGFQTLSPSHPVERRADAPAPWTFREMKLQPGVCSLAASHTWRPVSHLPAFMG